MSTFQPLPTEMLSKLWRAIIEFNMIEPGDRILIGLSGGKDSMFLTAALAHIHHYAKLPFQLACYTVDTQFDNNFPLQELQEFCHRYGLEHYHDQVNVLEAWGNKGNTPCFTCAYFRRAATNRRAKELGFNKVALAHHHDDAVETFALNLFTSGQLKTFLPVTYLSRMDLSVLRPLLYYREQEVIDYVDTLQLQPLKNPCPYDGHTKREETKELIRRLSAVYPEVYEHLAAAMRTSPQQELWPQALNQKEMATKFRQFWGKK